MVESKLAADALRIWEAGVVAVQPERCLPESVAVEGDWLLCGDTEIYLYEVNRIAVVGAGKAGAGMVRALETTLGPSWLYEKQVQGWVNVPADCVDQSTRIHLHAARPPGANVPTGAGEAGTREILRIVSSLDSRDLCIVLLSGGGSALLPAPIEGITIEDKIAVAEELAAVGANIEQLNTVRRALSRVKGGGLLRACTAGRMIVLVISDVPGDSLEVIASGPTIICPTLPGEAIETLRELQIEEHPRLARVREVLTRPSLDERHFRESPCQVDHVLLANNAVAVDAAGIEAERLGYNHAMTSATTPEGPAEEVGRHLARMALAMRDGPGPNCLITGGEPTVVLPPQESRGRGGRNQQLVLAALKELGDCRGIALMSGGTDGEDGPTDAAGALVDEMIARAAQEQGSDIHDSIARCDAYNFFAPLGALLKTGPTHANVCDLRVVVVEQHNRTNTVD